MSRFIFVYGTLKRGLAPPAIRETAARLNFVREAFVYGRIYDLGCYPGFVGGGRERVYGELFEIPDEEVLARLDEYEGIEPGAENINQYVRKIITIYCGDEAIEGWIYEYNQDLSNAVLIPSGRYQTKPSVTSITDVSDRN